MKKEDVHVGSTYAVKVSGSVVPVKITQEKWTGDKHTGWIGLNTKTKRPVRIKSAAKLRAAVGTDAKGHNPQIEPDAPDAPAKPSEKKPKGEKAAKTPKPPKPEKAKKLSCLDAAAQVLASAGKPMTAKELIEALATQGLWSSPGGKTPEASLYAAIIREIAAKGRDARFRKTERGSFEHSSAVPAQEAA